MQVTFKTPSPAISPNPSEASSDSHRSQLSTPPLLPATTQRDPLTSSPMPHHLAHMYQMGSNQGPAPPPFTQHNQITESSFPNQQFTGQPPWVGVPGMGGSAPPPQVNMGRPIHQQNLPLNSGPGFNLTHNGNSKSPQEVLRQLQTNTPSQSDLLTAGVFNRPPMEGFHQLGGSMPRRPGDMGSRMREPAPRMLEMMGMARAPPSFGPVEGGGNPNRFHPPGSEGQGFDSSPRMTQAPPFRMQDVDKTTTQAKISQLNHALLSPGTMNPHLFGMDSRQNVGGTGGMGVSAGSRNVFGETEVGPSRGPGLSPPMGMGWGPGQNDNKNYHMNHPPPTLANLLQQHGPVDIRLNLPMDPSTDHFSSGLPRLSLVNNPSMNNRSPPGVGPLGSVHLEMLTSTQPPGSIPMNQQTRGQQPFMPEVS